MIYTSDKLFSRFNQIVELLRLVTPLYYNAKQLETLSQKFIGLKT